MLIFNQRQHRYNKYETWMFLNSELCADYYRVWDGLYTRVIPVYSKPEQAGDYDARRMYQRPKQRLQPPLKDELRVTFYPEGGSLVEGLESRVAFDVTDQYEEAVSIAGQLTAGGETIGRIATTHEGRGVFTVTPTEKRLKATFTWRGKNYSFNLPKAEPQGAVLSLDNGLLTITAHGLPADRQYAVSVLCRGALKHFEEIHLSEGKPTTVKLPTDALPMGVNDVTLFDSDGRILADRLFFVGGNTTAGKISTITPINPTTTYAPYEQVSVALQLPEPNSVFSVAVRDTRTDEPTYNDGNLMTDLLLSSELRGFIAHPAYYFERDDAEHRSRLDLLLMVQGWRKYKWKELADTARQMRYQPEKTMTVSGAVYKMLGIVDVEPEEVPFWQNGLGRVDDKRDDDSAETDSESSSSSTESDVVSSDADRSSSTSATSTSLINFVVGPIENANDRLGINHKKVKSDVLVEAEVILGNDIVAAVQKTKEGRFIFEIPPFYGATYLNMKAYKERDSLKKSMLSRKDATVFREDAFPDYFVRRDMPYPVFVHKYNYYENHAPEWEVIMEEDTLTELSMEKDYHQLRNVDVKGRRRGKRAIDWHKPAFVCDAYDIYNDLTDYGLSYGKFDMRMFPLQVAKFLYGNMGRYNRFNVDGRLNSQIYWRNYTDIIDMGSDESSEMQESGKHLNNRSSTAIFNNLKLGRLDDVRVFSDYEPRNEDSLMVESYYAADATVEMVPIAADGTQTVFRDRHIYLHGFNMPADCYQPDYSRARPAAPTDYRRTLYWNPNAVADDQGRFTATFYNNARDTRIKVSAAGVTTDGLLMYYP